VHLTFMVDGNIRTMILNPVLLVRKLKTNLISVSRITSAGNKVEFEGEKCRVLDTHRRPLLVAHRTGDLYLVNTRSLSSVEYNSTSGSQQAYTAAASDMST